MDCVGPGTGLHGENGNHGLAQLGRHGKGTSRKISLASQERQAERFGTAPTAVTGHADDVAFRQHLLHPEYVRQVAPDRNHPDTVTCQNLFTLLLHDGSFAFVDETVDFLVLRLQQIAGHLEIAGMCAAHQETVLSGRQPAEALFAVDGDPETAGMSGVAGETVYQHIAEDAVVAVHRPQAAHPAVSVPLSEISVNGTGVFPASQHVERDGQRHDEVTHSDIGVAENAEHGALSE